MPPLNIHQRSVLVRSEKAGIPDNRVTAYRFLIHLAEFLCHLHSIRTENLTEDGHPTWEDRNDEQLIVHRVQRCMSLARVALSESRYSRCLKIGRSWERHMLLGGNGAIFVGQILGSSTFKDCTYGTVFAGAIRDNTALVRRLEVRIRITILFKVVLYGV